MKKIRIKILSIIALLFATSCTPPETQNQTSTNCKTPRLTVIIVIDQFGHHYLPKLKHNFKYGLKFLLDNGVVYHNAIYPYGAPCTPVGHATISSGALGKDSGFAYSDWLNEDGIKISVEKDDDVQSSAVFSKTGTYDYGISAKNLHVDTLADQFVLRSEPSDVRKAFAISHKDFACVAMGGHLGKSIWFDEKTGNFTTSKAYFDKMPEWLSEFNNEQKMSQLKETSWQLCYPKDSPEYNFSNITDYRAAGFKFSLVAQPQKINHSDEEPFELYVKTPTSNKQLIDLAKKCIDSNLKPNDKFLLELSLSPLDRLCHPYGPNSIETIDMIYHIDKQLGDFIKYAQEKVGAENVLFVLTADHGIPPMPEVLNARGYKKSLRIQTKPLIKEVNQILEEKFKIKNFVLSFKKVHFFVDQKILKTLNKETRKNIFKTIKEFILKLPGVKNAWTPEELASKSFAPDSAEQFFKNQYYPGRSGDIICQTEPYCVFTTYATGTSHRSPYDYDTHVPLIFYQKGSIENKNITQRVWMPQLAVTVAKILNISRPTAATYETLPGID